MTYGKQPKRSPLYFLAVALLLPTAVNANEVPVTAIANPQATSSGSVTNQAVQVINGQWPTNSYGGGVQCQGPALQFTPFLFGTRSGQTPFNEFVDTDLDGQLDYTGQKNNWSLNPGASLTISFPLDRQLQRQCKESAATWNRRQNAEADKARLDFELVRLVRCGEARKAGIMFHPNSPYAGICADVVVRPPQPVASSSTPSAPSSGAESPSSPNPGPAAPAEPTRYGPGSIKRGYEGIVVSPPASTGTPADLLGPYQVGSLPRTQQL